MNKKIWVVMMFAAAMIMVAACSPNKKGNSVAQAEQNDDDSGDSTVYGVCGDNTAMHTLELITVQGDTANYIIDPDDEAQILGGLMAGDKLAVVAHKNDDDENVATQVINLTTLQGKWSSIDKQFEIMEDGTVNSYVKEENKPWTSWKIYNGKLVLNKDTFDIDNLGADSLYLENNYGIFAFKRVMSKK